MPKKNTETIRWNVTFSTAIADYLKDLAAKGTHGSDVVGVIRTMVEQGVRDAIREGFIDRR